MNLKSRLESLLFVNSDPLEYETASKITGASIERVQEAIDQLSDEYRQQDRGLSIIKKTNQAQMVASPENSDVVEELTDRQVKSDLTRAQLEALTIIAYRSPITKPELEEIRGVNCTRILRNLMMRGLIEEQEKEDRIVSEYILSSEALQYLGINSTEELPDYEELSSHEYIEDLLEQKND
ncbi:MAG: SMC-Scp complex subunit ScpB [Candidatus Magasanikbacteria bacterium]